MSAKTKTSVGETTQTRKQQRCPDPSGPLSPIHQQFVDAVITGATPTDAYMELYPGTSRTSAYNSSSRLMKDPEIWQRVADGQMAIQRRRAQQNRQEIVERLARIEARLMTLADIIDGRWQDKHTTINKDNGKIIERHHSSPAAALRAIQLEIKLEDIRTQLQDKLAACDEQQQQTSEQEELGALTPEEVKERMYYLDGKIYIPQPIDQQPTSLTTTIQLPTTPNKRSKTINEKPHQNSSLTDRSKIINKTSQMKKQLPL